VAIRAPPKPRFPGDLPGRAGVLPHFGGSFPSPRPGVQLEIRPAAGQTDHSSGFPPDRLSVHRVHGDCSAYGSVPHGREATADFGGRQPRTDMPAIEPPLSRSVELDSRRPRHVPTQLIEVMSCFFSSFVRPSGTQPLPTELRYGGSTAASFTPRAGSQRQRRARLNVSALGDLGDVLGRFHHRCHRIRAASKGAATPAWCGTTRTV
jgi:hypothetical protein